MRFPQFTEEWETKKLGDVMDFKVTNSFSRENLNYKAGTVKNIHYGDIHTKFQTLFDTTKEVIPFINEEINLDRISNENYCKEGDVIFADASEDLNDVGKSIEIVNVNGEKLLSGLHTLLARPKKSIFHLGFNGYLFKSNSVRTQIQKESQGSKVLSINVGRISKIDLSFPAVDEQQKITSFFALLDERIQTQNKIIEQLETLIRDFRNRIFKQKIRFTDDDGKYFPEWIIHKLSDISERIIKKNSVGSQNVLTISAQFGLISQLEFFNKSVSAKDVSGYYLLEKNEFAYNRSYSSGYPMGAVKRLKKYDKGIVSTLYICFRFNSIVNLDFIEQYFESGIQNAEIEKIAQEGARNHGLLNVGVSDFFNIEVSLPSLEEQQKIASFLSSIDQKIQTEKEILIQAENQKKYLLQQMLA
ncbi:restriction endonuclease subunit S [Sphingobacterium thalpophilum]|uniref:EcoKI restriction-modification system protein HsdS n=1 Tax=Sphingobacterium thalpophilum TaxID=259 RepID=A0A4U9VC26_9SPHI|nr:restriction endonuclease subunit S [Sphingobacterium thalpophilum]VTR43593.1 EcoKI restriction-modification system protein HsdS [Sphingobacterium thalpophilum]